MELLLVVAAAVAVGAAYWVGRSRERLAAQSAISDLERRSSAAAADIKQLSTRLDEAQERAGYLEQQFQEADRARVKAETRMSELEHVAADQIALLDAAKKSLSDAFQALAAQALKVNSEGFLMLADQKFKAMSDAASANLEGRETAIRSALTPITGLLEKFDGQVRELEEKRAQAYGGLLNEVQLLRDTAALTKQETANLVKALRQPTVAGRWGEMQLRRVVELAEMVEHCDFVSQEGVRDDDVALRPDMLIHMPGGRLVVVDAKCPTQAYLDAVDATSDEERASKLKQHAQQVRAHIQRLSAKAYWEQFHPTPAFVVLFLPGENLFRAALENDPALIDAAIAQRVVPASPTTLISHLRAIHYGWQQERIAENAEQISQLGRELHDRIAVWTGHASTLRQHLDRSVESFNDFVASLEGRVLPLARRFKALGTGGDKTIPELRDIDRTTRTLRQIDAAEVDAMLSAQPGGDNVETLAPTGNEKDQSNNHVLRACANCGQEFSQPRRQGHPFERCEACRQSPAVVGADTSTPTNPDANVAAAVAPTQAK